MKSKCITLLLLFFLLPIHTIFAQAPVEPLSLWYCQPAERWTEALPIGNGRLGGMIFGDVSKGGLDKAERIPSKSRLIAMTDYRRFYASNATYFLRWFLFPAGIYLTILAPDFA